MQILDDDRYVVLSQDILQRTSFLASDFLNILN